MITIQNLHQASKAAVKGGAGGGTGAYRARKARNSVNQNSEMPIKPRKRGRYSVKEGSSTTELA